MVSGMSSRKKAGAQAADGPHLSFWQGTLWGGPGPGFLPHGSSCGAGVRAASICRVAGTEQATHPGLRIYFWGCWGLRKLRCGLTVSGVGEANLDHASG